MMIALHVGFGLPAYLNKMEPFLVFVVSHVLFLLRHCVSVSATSGLTSRCLDRATYS